jgi:hypothetical protein
MVGNGYLLCFRWLELLVEPRKVSGQTKLAVPSNRHQPPKSSRGHGLIDRTPQPASAGSDGPISSPVSRS